MYKNTKHVQIAQVSNFAQNKQLHTFKSYKQGK